MSYVNYKKYGLQYKTKNKITTTLWFTTSEARDLEKTNLSLNPRVDTDSFKNINNK